MTIWLSAIYIHKHVFYIIRISSYYYYDYYYIIIDIIYIIYYIILYYIIIFIILYFVVSYYKNIINFKIGIETKRETMTDTRL